MSHSGQSLPNLFKPGTDQSPYASNSYPNIVVPRTNTIAKISGPTTPASSGIFKSWYQASYFNHWRECGVFTYEVAETKVTQVMDFARKHQQNLRTKWQKPK